MMALRSVNARAVRSAYIVDSVPELVKRSWSRLKRRWKRSAASVAEGDGVTNSVPVSRALATAATTVGLRWPASIAPKPIERSSNLRPSTSVSQAPLALLIATGYGSQCWNDEGTPSGKRPEGAFVVRTRAGGLRLEPLPLGCEQGLHAVWIERGGALGDNPIGSRVVRGPGHRSWGGGFGVCAHLGTVPALQLRWRG